MNERNFTAGFSVREDPETVFAAIKQVRGWWSDGIQGDAERIGSRFTHRVRDLHRCDLTVKEMVPSEKVVWTVIDNHFSFTRDETEWKGTEIVFEIAQKGEETELKFTHVGLVPEYECFEICQDGWRTYLESLRQLITTGKGQPNVGEARTVSEQALMDGAMPNRADAS